MINRELLSEVRQQRKLSSVENGKVVPGSVPYLRGLIDNAATDVERDALMAELAGEYLRAELVQEYVQVQQARVQAMPDDPLAWCSLADALSTSLPEKDEAKKAVITGVAKARIAGSFIRYALLCQADIARRTLDAALFEESLQQLIDDAEVERENDCELTEQIVIDLPDKFVSSSLVDTYRQLII